MQTDGVVIIGIWWFIYSVSRNGSVSMIPAAAAAISGKSDVFSGRHTPSFHTLSAAKPTSQHATPRKNSEAIFSYMSASTKLLVYSLPQKNLLHYLLAQLNLKYGCYQSQNKLDLIFPIYPSLAMHAFFLETFQLSGDCI